MSNQKLLKILNPILALTFLAAAIAIALLRTNAISSSEVNNIVYKFHEIGGQIFILLVILHIILNWNWVKSQIFGIKAKPKTKKK